MTDTEKSIVALQMALAALRAQSQALVKTVEITEKLFNDHERDKGNDDTSK